MQKQNVPSILETRVPMHASFAASSKSDATERLPCWDALRECASDARMRIAQEMRMAHMINAHRLPALHDAASLKNKADCGASGAASLSSLLDDVLLEHASAVPSRSQLVLRKKQQAAAAVNVSQILQPLVTQPHHRRLGKTPVQQQGEGAAGAGGGGGRRAASRLAHIREDAEGQDDEWHGSTLSLQQYDGVIIKSRTHSRQGIDMQAASRQTF